MKKKIDELKDKLFGKIHSNNLIYNTCWEDPRIDRQLLEIDSESDMVMITSAGCNALDYLLDSPKRINCIDLNYRQNALLELKKANFLKGDWDDLFKLFGRGHHTKAEKYYNQSIRPYLPGYAIEFWDEKISLFNKKRRGSFYFYGTSGSFAWLFNKYLSSNKKTRKLVNALMHSETLEEQNKVYEELEPRLLNKMVNWLMNRHITMSLLGVPRAQRQLILDKFPKGGVSEFIKESLKHIFTNLDIKDNYFWYLYTHGNYTQRCSPEYLKQDNFEKLQANVLRLNINTNSISGFLTENPGKYSHYILLDHQDWLAFYKPEALEEEWKLILENSKPGTKILLRSATPEINFFPDFIKDKVDFKQELTDKLHQKDRVGTYGCTYLAVVK